MAFSATSSWNTPKPECGNLSRLSTKFGARPIRQAAASDFLPLAVNDTPELRVDFDRVVNAWQPDEYANQFRAEVARQSCFASLYYGHRASRWHWPGRPSRLSRRPGVPGQSTRSTTDIKPARATIGGNNLHFLRISRMSRGSSTAVIIEALDARQDECGCLSIDRTDLPNSFAPS